MSGKVPVTAPIDTAGVNDTYATHYSNKGKGGLHIVDTDTERNSIPLDRRINGMHVYVRSTEILTPNTPHGYISIYNQGNTPDWIDYPIRKILFVDNPQTLDFAKCKKGDQLITDDYLYVCVESASDENGNTPIFKKIIMSL